MPLSVYPPQPKAAVDDPVPANLDTFKNILETLVQDDPFQDSTALPALACGLPPKAKAEVLVPHPAN